MRQVHGMIVIFNHLFSTFGQGLQEGEDQEGFGNSVILRWEFVTFCLQFQTFLRFYYNAHMHAGWVLGVLGVSNQSLTLWMFSSTTRLCNINEGVMMKTMMRPMKVSIWFVTRMTKMLTLLVMRMTNMSNFQGKPLDILLLQSTKGKVSTYIMDHKLNCWIHIVIMNKILLVENINWGWF